MKRKIHINELGVLFSKSDPTAWAAQLKRMSEEKKYMAMPYMPLRLAIVAEMSVRGTGIGVLRAGLLKTSGKNALTIKAKSRQAYEKFLKWYPNNLAGIQRSYVGLGAGDEFIEYNGYELSGNFHIKATDLMGNDVYVYFHCSDWPDDQRDAHIELLATIAEVRYNATRRNVWFVDLTAEIIHKPKANSKRIQARLTKILQHLTMLTKGMAA